MVAPKASKALIAQTRGERTVGSNRSAPAAATAATPSSPQFGVRCQAAIAETDSTTISSQERGQPAGSAVDVGLDIAWTICRPRAPPQHFLVNSL